MAVYVKPRTSANMMLQHTLDVNDQKSACLPLSTGAALAPRERTLWPLLAAGRRGGLHGGPRGTHHDVHP